MDGCGAEELQIGRMDGPVHAVGNTRKCARRDFPRR